VSVSYAVGALGGLLYLRLLGRSVDGVGGDGGGGGLGQPRLLVPVILVLVFNRWGEGALGGWGLAGGRAGVGERAAARQRPQH
jgi:ATP synthase protein I